MHDRNARTDTPDDLWAAWRRYMDARPARPSERRKVWSDLDECSDWLGDKDANQHARLGEMQEQMETMANVINALLDRVNVLERLAVDDDARLAAEIESLRR